MRPRRAHRQWAAACGMHAEPFMERQQPCAAAPASAGVAARRPFPYACLCSEPGLPGNRVMGAAAPQHKQPQRPQKSQRAATWHVVSCRELQPGTTCPGSRRKCCASTLLSGTDERCPSSHAIRAGPPCCFHTLFKVNGRFAGDRQQVLLTTTTPSHSPAACLTRVACFS